MRNHKRTEADRAITLIEKYIIELEEALIWMRALYPNAQMLDVCDDDISGCHLACPISAPTIAELREIDAIIGNE